jgi:hypothetical protein
MALFPNIDPKYYTDNSQNVLSRMEDFYAESLSINQSFWTEADVDTRFEAGDQAVWNELYGNLPANRQHQLSFNRIRRVVNMISGHQRRNRKSTIVVPVENGDQETADQFSKIMMWLSGQEQVLDTVSEAFHGALVTGMNLMQVWMDYRSDPVSGNIKVDHCSYNSFLIDPYFRKLDLSDCNAIWKRSYITKREALSLLPGREDEILGLNTYQQDGKFQYMPENYNYDIKNLMSYDEFYYRSFRTQQLLVDTQTGESFEWSSDDNEALDEFLRLYPQITLLKGEVPTTRLSIVLEGRVMYDGPNPLGIDQYPFVPVVGYYTPQLPYFPDRVQGVVRGLRDPQYLYNRRKAIELDILESQVNSGWVFKENAPINPKDLFKTGQGQTIALKEEAQMTDIQRIEPAQVPPSMMELSRALGQEIEAISGVNEELLGSATDDKAGILSQLRQGAGLTTLQPLFDNLDRSQKLLGKIIISCIQANFTPGKVKRIIEQEPSAQFYNKAFGKYDAAVEEGLNTTTQRQMQFAQLLHLKEVGVNIPDNVILEATTLQNKNDLIQAVEQQNQQQAEMAQAQAQAAMQEQEARTNLANARAVADQGLGAERFSRIPENSALAAERISQARENIADSQAARSRGVLDIVKALKEIDSIDIQNVEKLLALANLVKNSQNEEQQPIPVQQETELGS